MPSQTSLILTAIAPTPQKVIPRSRNAYAPGQTHLNSVIHAQQGF
ncbi:MULTISPECIES: hypothetical protein [Dolichospermum]|nr:MULTISPECIES: hypothetical protein [Dolichospermum]MDB9436013.1 hypothetical protein [Dolichospermum lemmermannii CS-548]